MKIIVGIQPIQRSCPTKSLNLVGDLNFQIRSDIGKAELWSQVSQEKKDAQEKDSKVYASQILLSGDGEKEALSKNINKPVTSSISQSSGSLLKWKSQNQESPSLDRNPEMGVEWPVESPYNLGKAMDKGASPIH